MIIFSLLVWLILLAVPLMFQRFWIVEEARRGATRNALTMFLFSFFSLMICAIAMSVVLFFSLLVIFVNVWFALPISIGGLIVFIRMIRRSVWRDNAALERRAVTRYQIWIQDLFVGGIVLGTILTGYTALRGPDALAEEMAYMIIGEVIAIIPALFIGLGVIRFHPHATNPKMRVLWVAGFMLAGSIPFVSLLWMLPCWFSFLLGMSKLPENDEVVEPKVIETTKSEIGEELNH